MRKTSVFLFVILCCMLLLFAGVFVACNDLDNEQGAGEDSGQVKTEIFTVTFDTQGGSNISELKVEQGQTLKEFATPTKQCSRLIGFALDRAGENMWDLLTDTVEENITLYAIWEESHTWGEWTVTTPATCTVDGERYHECSVCGKTETDVIIAAHTWGEWEETIAPTCESAGEMTCVCSACNQSKTQATEALGHNYEGAEWQFDEINHWRECVRCGKESERVAHMFENGGECECGLVEVSPASEFRFVSLGNNSWRLASYLGSRRHVFIPTAYNNGTVVAISDEAFKDNTSIQSVIIPDTVTSIGARAFAGCTSLTAVTVSKNLETIGSDAFADCTNIANATIPAIVAPLMDKSSLEVLHVTAGDIAQSSFANCANLTTLTLSADVQSVGVGSFKGCTKLKYITVEYGVKSIGGEAFANCSQISEIAVPDSVTNIGNGAFSGCYGLVTMTLPFVGGSADAVAPSESTLFGYIFGSNKYLGAFETVQLYGTAEGESATYYIPSNLTSVTVGKEILFGAFYGCDALQNITLTAATSLSDYAFFNNVSLTNIIFSENVNTIGKMTFAYCTALAEIDFLANIKTVGADAMLQCAWYNAQPDGLVYIGKALYTYKGNMPDNTSVSVLDGTYSITAQAFAECAGLSSVIIPDSVAYIGERAFYNCMGLSALVVSDGVLSIGKDAFAGCSSLETVTIPAMAIAFIPKTNLQTVTVTKGDIGEQAFYNCGSITSLTLGNAVTSIGSQAFYGCTGLTDIYWNAVAVADLTGGSNVFYNAGTPENGITVTFGDGVTKIPAYAFYGCTILTSLTVSDSVTRIGNYSFYNCSGLTLLNIPDSVTSIGDYAFYGCVGLTSLTIPDSVTVIGNHSFDGCVGLTTLTIENSVTSIGDSAFYGCVGLTSLTIPDSVTVIGNHSFDGCAGLTSLTIGNSVTSIGDSAFYGCEGLTSLTIPESVTVIGTSAFENCKALTEIYWNAVSVQDFSQGSRLFDYAGTSGNGITVTFGDGVTKIPACTFNACTALTAVSISQSVTSIGRYAFELCKNLTSISIPDSVTDIEDGAFRYCDKLTSFVIPDSVTNLGADVFRYCTGLTSVTIGSGVTSIKNQTFLGCESLTSITISHSVTSIGDSAFSFCNALQNVTFNGNVNEWNAISKGADWNEECPFKSVKCSDGTVNL